MSKKLFLSLLILAYSARILAGITEITTKEDFDKKVIKTPGLVVVKASATWCGPCKDLKPKLERISEEYKEIDFYEVDDKNNIIVREFGVRGYPTTLFFVDGKKVDSVTGSLPDVIRSKIDQYKSGKKNGAMRKAAPAQVEEEAVEMAAPQERREVRPVRRQVRKTTTTRRHGRSRRANSCTSCK